MLGDAVCPGGCTGSFKVKESSILQCSHGPHSPSPSSPLCFCLLTPLFPTITRPITRLLAFSPGCGRRVGQAVMQFICPRRDSRGPSIMGISIEPIGPSRRGRGNSSLSLEMKRELFWGASAWPWSSLLCPPQGYFRCPQVTWLSQGSLHTGSFT